MIHAGALYSTVDHERFPFSRCVLFSGNLEDLRRLQQILRDYLHVYEYAFYPVSETLALLHPATNLAECSYRALMIHTGALYSTHVIVLGGFNRCGFLVGNLEKLGSLHV